MVPFCTLNVKKMSWLPDTKAFVASLAKSAMAEAQKTLDKALEISEEEEEQKNVKDGEEEFNNRNLNKSQWGSFTGSFFSAEEIEAGSFTSEKKSSASAEPVSLQPSSKFLLKTVDNNEASGSSIMTASSSNDEEMDAEKPSSSDELNSSMSSSHTTVNANDLKLASSSVSLSTVSSSLLSITEKPLDAEEFSNEEENQGTASLLEDAMRQENTPTPATATTASSGNGNNRSSGASPTEEKRSEASSSSKSYELLKLESLPTSGHTSGDDVCTNTSSDIEIISSPGLSEAGGGGHKPCNSNCLASPGKRNSTSSRSKKGHLRTASEISVSCSEESFASVEVDRLLKKISDMSEILDARETKLVEMSRSNLELQEKNMDLTSQVKEAMKINAKLNESNLASEEFTQRLATLERKLQQTMAEKDKLKVENRDMKKDSSTRLSQVEVKDLLQEKDEIIQDLRQEGETLSKQLGKHSEVIKKLRSKEKSSDKEVKSLRSQLDDKTKECERLQKSLGAKEELERAQIESIQNLTSANSQWEEANATMASDLEDSNEKVNGLKLSLEGAYKEVAELRRGLLQKEGEAAEAALQKETEARQALQNQLREATEAARSEKEDMLNKIDELREALSALERTASRNEDRMRQEREDLQVRLQQSEARHQELSGSMSASTRPLLRQIESLQASLSEAQLNSDRAERSLSERLQQTSVQLASAQERERNASEQYRVVSGKAASLEAKLASVTKTKLEMEAGLEAQREKSKSLLEASAKETALADQVKKSFSEEVGKLKRQHEVMQGDLEAVKEELVGEKRKNVALVEQLKDRDRRIKEMSGQLEAVKSKQQHREASAKSSPTLSMVSDSSHVWPDEVYESRGVNSGYDSLRFLGGGLGSTSALLESLQSQVKQKEGENVHLQMEVSRLECVKQDLTNELSRLSERAEQVEELQQNVADLRQQHLETEQKYQTMLTMYGEKVEETEELRLDLQDVKEMYKMQIEDLLKRTSK